jgi:hypothetical protein
MGKINLMKSDLYGDGEGGGGGGGGEEGNDKNILC